MREAAVQARLASVVVAVAHLGGPAVARAAPRDHVDHAADRVACRTAPSAGPSRSRCARSVDGGMFCSAARPMVPGLMRTPSTSTSVWLLSAPRMNTAVVCPGPPLRPRSSPAWKRSSSLTSPRRAALDGVAVDDDHRGEHFLERRGDARGRHHQVIGGSEPRRQRRTDWLRRRSRTGTADDASMHTPRARPVGGPNSSPVGQGGGGEGAGARNPAARPPRGWSRTPGRSPGSRVDLLGPARIPFPRSLRSGCREVPGRCRLDSTTVAGAAPACDRLPVLPREPRGIT